MLDVQNSATAVNGASSTGQEAVRQLREDLLARTFDIFFISNTQDLGVATTGPFFFGILDTTLHIGRDGWYRNGLRTMASG